MKRNARFLSRLATHATFVFGFMMVAAAVAGPSLSVPQAKRTNSFPGIDRRANFNSQSKSDAVWPTLEIVEMREMNADSSRAAGATRGIIINIASSGWQPGEAVEVSIYNAKTRLSEATFNLVADQSGALSNPNLMLRAGNGIRYIVARGRLSQKFVTRQFVVHGPLGGPFVNTFDSTCTTSQTDFVLGDTICAQVTALDTKTFSARFDWIDPDGIVQEMGPVIVANGQTDTFMIPAMGPNAKVGLWRVQITDVNDGSNLASQGINVGGGGPEAEAIITLNADCETEQTGFIGGSTVCARVTGIDSGEENTFRIDWIRPDSSVAEMGPVVTMNNQADTFAIPISGPAGTWTVQLTRLSDGGAQTQATFFVETLPCTLTCPDNFSVSNDPGQCGAIVNFNPVTEGDCGTVTCTPAGGSFFPVGTTTATCESTAKQNCSFTVTVNDTEAPVITCPAAITVTTSPTCQAGAGAVVTFPEPSASDNCACGVVENGLKSVDGGDDCPVICNPPSGSTFPAGTTTVTCMTTDASGNTASCSFTVLVFSGCLQDDTNAGNVVLFNTVTGEYRFCCGGVVIKEGNGTITRQGCVLTIQHNTSDRRVLIKVDFTQKKGSGSLQMPPGAVKCTITDKNTLNNSCVCGADPP